MNLQSFIWTVLVTGIVALAAGFFYRHFFRWLKRWYRLYIYSPKIFVRYSVKRLEQGYYDTEADTQDSTED